MANLFSDDNRKLAEKLYRAYWHDAVKTTRKILKDRSLSEDCAQQAFMKLFDNMDKIPPEVCAASRRYILVIARNIALTEYNRRKRIQEIPEEDEDFLEGLPDPESVEETVIQRCTSQEIADAMMRLPQRDADMLTLIYGYDYTVKECADLLGISAEAAKKVLQRARTKLRKELEKDGQSDI